MTSGRVADEHMSGRSRHPPPVTRHPLLPAHSRLPGSLPAGLADPQAEGNPARACGTAAGGTVVALECQAREPPSAVRPGVGEHPVADEEERLDRAAAPDDEAGGAGASVRGVLALGSRCCWILGGIGFVIRSLRSARHPGSRFWSTTPRCGHAQVPDIVGRCGLPPLGRSLAERANWTKLR